MSFRIFKEFFDLKKLKPKTIESDIFEHVEVPNELKSSMKSVDDEIEIFYETENFTQTEEFKESQNEMKSEGLYFFIKNYTKNLTSLRKIP